MSDMSARDELQQWLDDVDRITGKISGRMMDVDLARRVLGEMDELKAAVQDRDDALADVRRGAKEARADLAKARNVIEQVRKKRDGEFYAWLDRYLTDILADAEGSGQ